MAGSHAAGLPHPHRATVNRWGVVGGSRRWGRGRGHVLSINVSAVLFLSIRLRKDYFCYRCRAIVSINQKLIFFPCWLQPQGPCSQARLHVSYQGQVSLSARMHSSFSAKPHIKLHYLRGIFQTSRFLHYWQERESVLEAATKLTCQIFFNYVD